MAALGEDIRAAIVGSTTITAVMTNYASDGAVEQATVRENPPSPRLWYIRDRENEELDLSNIGGLVESTWSIEVHGESDGTTIAIADACKRAYHGHIGTFGGRSVLSVKLDDHDDDYVIRGDASEDGLFVSALRMTIWHDSTAST
jgi:hypothetical protein